MKTIEFNNVALLGWNTRNGLPNFDIRLNAEQVSALVEFGYTGSIEYKRLIGSEAKSRRHFSGPCFRVHDTIPNEWASAFGPLVKGDVILSLNAEPVHRPSATSLFKPPGSLIFIQAIRVTHRPTWDEVKQYIGELPE